MTTLSLKHLLSPVIRSCTGATSMLSTTSTVYNNKIASLKAAESVNGLRVQWEDGKHAEFDYVWLRDWAPNRHPTQLNELTLGVEPKSWSVTENGHGIHIDWPPWTNAMYSSEWLRTHAALQNTDSSEQPAFAENVTPLQRVTRFEFDPTSADKNKIKQIAQQLQHDGCIQLKSSVSPVETMKHLGLSETLVEERTHLTAHTRSSVTGLHTGCAQMGDVPRFVVLNVLKANGVGSFQVVDGQEVARRCWREKPLDFAFLMSQPIGYTREPADMTSDTHPNAKHVVVTLKDGHIEQIVFNNAYRSSDPGVHPQNVRQYYSALKAFNDYMYRAAIQLPPCPGEMIIIDNHRVLHGNTAFPHDPEHQCMIEELYFD